jgi:hypothetical protein
MRVDEFIVFDVSSEIPTLTKLGLCVPGTLRTTPTLPWLGIMYQVNYTAHTNVDWELMYQVHFAPHTDVDWMNVPVTPRTTLTLTWIGIHCIGYPSMRGRRRCS